MERIIESNGLTDVFPSGGLQTENTKINVWLNTVTIEWDENGSSGSFQISVSLKTDSGTNIISETIGKNISVLDTENAPISVHDYIRDQVYNSVVAVDAYNMGTWNKLY